jgi:hypothetical protein
MPFHNYSRCSTASTSSFLHVERPMPRWGLALSGDFVIDATEMGDKARQVGSGIWPEA